MTSTTFRSWTRITKVVAEFAKRLALLDRVHISLKAFEDVASLVNNRQVNRQKLLDIDANRQQREQAKKGATTSATPSFVAGCSASASTAPMTTTPPLPTDDVPMGVQTSDEAEITMMSNVAASIKKLIQFANTQEQEESRQHVLGK